MTTVFFLNIGLYNIQYTKQCLRPIIELLCRLKLWSPNITICGWIMNASMNIGLSSSLIHATIWWIVRYIDNYIFVFAQLYLYP